MPSSQTDTAVANGHDGHPHGPLAAASKKGKQKKPIDSNEASKLLQARISQLEQDAAGEKDQEAEIEREVKKANREMMQQVSKLGDMQKIDYLQRRSSELLAEMRRLERENQKNKKRGDNLQKEKDTNRAELSKTIGLKEKLEKLCRELQRDNNKFKNENKTLQDSQKQNRAAWDEKYAQLLSKLEGYQEEKDNPRKQVIEIRLDDLFRTRFKSFIEQYELRELHFHSLMRTKELEVQWHMGRYEREKKAAEAEAAKVRHLQAQVHAFGKTEAELRSQLNVYVDKFKQVRAPPPSKKSPADRAKVEDTLNNSNDLFLTFRKEMEDMSKKTKKLEKENEVLKRKYDAINGNMASMAEERAEWKKKAEAEQRKNEKLRSIIAQMQRQGRKAPPGVNTAIQNGVSAPAGEGEPDGDYSDYSEDEDGDEDLSEEFEDEEDDDTEEEAGGPANLKPAPRTFGPERPPSLGGPPTLEQMSGAANAE